MYNITPAFAPEAPFVRIMDLVRRGRSGLIVVCGPNISASLTVCGLVSKGLADEGNRVLWVSSDRSDDSPPAFCLSGPSPVHLAQAWGIDQLRERVFRAPLHKVVVVSGVGVLEKPIRRTQPAPGRDSSKSSQGSRLTVVQVRMRQAFQLRDLAALEHRVLVWALSPELEPGESPSSSNRTSHRFSETTAFSTARLFVDAMMEGKSGQPVRVDLRFVESNRETTPTTVYFDQDGVLVGPINSPHRSLKGEPHA